MTINKILDTIVYNGLYPTHQEIIYWAKDFNEYEAIMEVMQKLNLCTVTEKVEEVRKRNFITAPIWGSYVGKTVTYESGPSTLWSTNKQRIVQVKDLTGTGFSRFAEMFYSTQIADKREKREQAKREAERVQTERDQALWNRIKIGEAEKRERLERDRLERDRLALILPRRAELPRLHLVELPKVERPTLQRRSEESRLKYQEEEERRRILKEKEHEADIKSGAGEIIEPFYCACTIL